MPILYKNIAWEDATAVWPVLCSSTAPGVTPLSVTATQRRFVITALCRCLVKYTKGKCYKHNYTLSSFIFMYLGLLVPFFLHVDSRCNPVSFSFSFKNCLWYFYKATLLVIFFIRIILRDSLVDRKFFVDSLLYLLIRAVFSLSSGFWLLMKSAVNLIKDHLYIIFFTCSSTYSMESL